MRRFTQLAVAVLMGGALAVGLGGAATAADHHRWGLDQTGPQLRSAGPLAFGPDGILLVGDTKAAAVWAIDLAESGQEGHGVTTDVADVTQRIADAAGIAKTAVTINDLAVHRESGRVYLSTQIRTDAGAEGQIWRTNPDGAVEHVALEKLAYAKLPLPDPPADEVVGEGRRQRNPRDEAVTELSYLDGRVLVSGVAAEKGASSVWEFQFPFNGSTSAANVEIYHAAHGRVEDNAAIRSFVTMVIDGEPNLLAGFTCTPLVKWPLKDLAPGGKVRGTTVAELGNRNRPLDMLVYDKDGSTYVLMSNTARGLMKISTEDLEKNEGLTEPVRGGGTAGQEFETIESLSSVVEMDKISDDKMVALVQQSEDTLDLKEFDLP